MSFLLRRNRPWAQADWRDLDSLHSRADENPIRQPWGRYNTSRTCRLVSNELTIADYTETPFATGGVSYEHKALTPYWAYEFDASLNTAAFNLAEFMCFMTAPWSRVGTNYTDVLVCKLRYEGLSSNNSNIRFTKYDPSSAETVFTQQALAEGFSFFNGTYHTIRVEWDNDEVVRAYVDGTLRIAMAVPDVSKLDPEKRSVNFSNQTTTTSKQRNFRLYDRNYNTISPKTYTDDFTTLSVLWHQQSAQPASAAGAYGVSGTTDGYRRHMYLGRSNTDQFRVSGVLTGPTSMGGQALTARSNLRATQGVDLFFSDTGWALRRKTAAETWSADLLNGSFAMATGQEWGILCHDSNVYEVQRKVSGVWTTINTYTDTSNLIPRGKNNRYSCVLARRNFFANSGFWDSWRFEDI